MRTIEEVKKLRDTLGEIVGTITQYGTDEEINSHGFGYICNVFDALNWVLEGISTEKFLSDSYLDISSWLRKKEKIKLETVV